MNKKCVIFLEGADRLLNLQDNHNESQTALDFTATFSFLVRLLLPFGAHDGGGGDQTVHYSSLMQFRVIGWCPLPRGRLQSKWAAVHARVTSLGTVPVLFVGCDDQRNGIVPFVARLEGSIFGISMYQWKTVTSIALSFFFS